MVGRGGRRVEGRVLVIFVYFIRVCEFGFLIFFCVLVVRLFLIDNVRGFLFYFCDWEKVCGSFVGF